MSWDDDDDSSGSHWMSDFIRIGFGSVGYGSSDPEPMTAYGRLDRRLKDGDRRFERAELAVSEELTAALKRIAITSARPA